LGNLTTFYKKLRDPQLREQFNITYDYQYNEIKHFYKSQQVTQRFYESKPPKPCRITAFWFGHILQMDLMVIGGGRTPQGHLKGLQKINGVRYLLNIVDVFSRYAWSFPLKHKQAPTVVAVIRKLIQELKQQGVRLQNLTMDNGTEFKNQHMDQLAYQFNLKLWYNVPGDHGHMGIIERFNRTLRTKINKFMESWNTKRFINNLPHIVSNYNNSYHRTIKTTPQKIMLASQNSNTPCKSTLRFSKVAFSKFFLFIQIPFILTTRLPAFVMYA